MGAVLKVEWDTQPLLHESKLPELLISPTIFYTIHLLSNKCQCWINFQLTHIYKTSITLRICKVVFANGAEKCFEGGSKFAKGVERY